MPGDPDKDVIYFGRTDFRNTSRLFGIKRSDRRQHVYIIGKTGTGKSALEANMIIQDIANGEGVCVVDPHGELVEGILTKIPEQRVKDVIYFNPADPDFHIGFNILELPDKRYKHLVASGLMGIFTKIWAGVWSARMEYILNNAILALLETPGTTLLGIPRLLVDKEYRQNIIANVTDPVVKAFWVNEFEQWKDQFRNEAIAPIQNKVGQFLSTALVRNIVGQSKSTIEIFDIMNTGKIFLVNVSKGRIGEDNSALLGAMIITKIQLAAMERVRIPEEERVDFYLYVDEFQNFATDSFAGILSEARKYRLNLIVAHQYVGQLVTNMAGGPGVSTRVRDAIFGNVGTMIIFRVGAADAEFLEPEFEPEFVIQDIVNLPNYCVYLKLMVNGVTCRPFSAATLPPFQVDSSPSIAEEIIEESRKRYARPKTIVEDEINRWSGMMSAADIVPRSSGDGVQYEANCSSCGKLTHVPFEPLPGRPVYCKDCLAKIKAGEMAPVRVPRAPVAKQLTKKDYADLAAVGIEFAMPASPTGGPASPTGGPASPAGGPASPTGGPASPAGGSAEPLEERRPPHERRSEPPRQPMQPVAPRPMAPVNERPAAVRDEVEVEPPPSQTLSLSELKSDGKMARPREHQPEINIETLQQEISESLKRAIAGTPAKPPIGEEEKQKEKGG
jgi:CxxC-x17-CxxC domain-containing protein